MKATTGSIDPFAARFDEPVFVVTADQDWAPDWALEVLLDETVGRGVPLHLFVTNASDLVTKASTLPGFTTGIHPNFLAGSSHGSTADDVIRHCLALVPAATTFRCHCFFESTPVLGKLFASGLTVDSNLGLFAQPGLVPLQHCTGLLRFPVFFEDDVFFNLAGPELDLGPLRRRLLAPGLKVVNVHPSLVGLNAPSGAYYDGQRGALFAGVGTPVVHGGRGTRVVLRELIDTVLEAGHRFESFQAIADECSTQIAGAREPGLYDWRSRSWAGPPDAVQPRS
jgi:hypothetical protein